MRVYVLERGYYSDTHVVGVTETEEEAKAFVEWDRKQRGADEDDYDDVRYEAFDTETIGKRMGEGLQGFHMYFTPSGECRTTGHHEYGVDYGPKTWSPEYWIQMDLWPQEDDCGHICVLCWARDLEHAVKVASDCVRAQRARPDWNDEVRAEIDRYYAKEKDKKIARKGWGV